MPSRRENPNREFIRCYEAVWSTKTGATGRHLGSKRKRLLSDRNGNHSNQTSVLRSNPPITLLLLPAGIRGESFSLINMSSASPPRSPCRSSLISTSSRMDEQQWHCRKTIHSITVSLFLISGQPSNCSNSLFLQHSFHLCSRCKPIQQSVFQFESFHCCIRNDADSSRQHEEEGEKGSKGEEGQE